MIFRMKCVKVEFDCCIVSGGLQICHLSTLYHAFPISWFACLRELRISWFGWGKLMIVISAHMLTHQMFKVIKQITSKQFNSVLNFRFDLERIIWIPNFWTEVLYLLNFLISKQLILFVFTQNAYSKRILKMSSGN